MRPPRRPTDLAQVIRAYMGEFWLIRVCRSHCIGVGCFKGEVKENAAEGHWPFGLSPSTFASTVVSPALSTSCVQPHKLRHSTSRHRALELLGRRLVPSLLNAFRSENTSSRLTLGKWLPHLRRTTDNEVGVCTRSRKSSGALRETVHSDARRIQVCGSIPMA